MICCIDCASSGRQAAPTLDSPSFRSASSSAPNSPVTRSTYRPLSSPPSNPAAAACEGHEQHRAEPSSERL